MNAPAASRLRLVDAPSILIGTGVAGAAFAVGATLSRRRNRRTADEARLRLERVEGELHTARRTSTEDRRVQDSILASMEEGVLLIDVGGTTVFANAALQRHLGEIPDGMGSLLPLEFRRAAQRAGYVDGVERCEVEVGSPARWLRGTAIPVSEDGSVLLVVRDVTDARHLDAVRRDFVANASHELKTPAASIQAAAETLRHAAPHDPEVVSRFAEQLEREALRLSRIVADLLDLSRLESGSDLDEHVHLDAIVREETQRFGDRAKADGVEVDAHVDQVTSVRGSSRDLVLLVRNLIDNAIRYTKPSGRVDIMVSLEDASVVVRVKDTGVGIPSRDLARVFERFYRVDRARSRETGGTGLGLAIVKHVAENHGGAVTVESELGRGSVFTVRIPSAT
jgi:signal transduction histidine kinase